MDAVGIVEQEKIDTQTLERKRSLKLAQLLEMVALGAADEELTALAGRTAGAHGKVALYGGGGADSDSKWRCRPNGHCTQPFGCTGNETRRRVARLSYCGRPGTFPPGVQTGPAGEDLEIQSRDEQVVDTVSMDRVLEAGFSAADTERARVLVKSFEAFITDHKDEITALQITVVPGGGSRPALPFEELKDLANILQQPPCSWTTEALWRAYAALERDRVRGVNERRVLTDVVSLVRHAVRMDDELTPYPELVALRYADWLKARETSGRAFTPEQRWWLDKIAEHVGVNLSFSEADFAVNGELAGRGGQVAAQRLFGAGLKTLLAELNQALA